MDVSSQHIRTLIEKTDQAFQNLRREPDSAELNCAYEEARNELNQYISSVRHHLAERRR